jgi:hypothetical protein
MYLNVELKFLRRQKHKLHLTTSEDSILLKDISKGFSLISGFRRDVDELCALLGYYAASCGNCLPHDAA